MTEKIVDLHPKATCTGSVPSEGDNFHNLRPVRLGDELPADLAPADIMDAARRMAELRDILEENDRIIAHAKAINARIEALLEDFDPRGGAA